MRQYQRFTLGLVLAISLASRSTLAQEPKVISLWPEGVPNQFPDHPTEMVNNGYISNVHTPTLTWYPASANSTTGTAIIICPGGGYGRLAFENAGLEPARWVAAQGISVFVLKYRHAPYRHPAPLRDVLRAVRLVRECAADFGIRENRIGVMGFSSGGHLAACAGTLYNDPAGRTGDPLDAVSARPDFLVLVYPVITLRESPDQSDRSRRNLLGPDPSPELIEQLSLARRVTKDTPPAFLVTTFEDSVVPAANSIQFFEAMQRAKVPAELHVFERGPHGFGMRPGYGPTSDWPRLLEGWLRLHGWLTAP